MRANVEEIGMHLSLVRCRYSVNRMCTTSIVSILGEEKSSLSYLTSSTQTCVLI